MINSFFAVECFVSSSSCISKSILFDLSGFLLDGDRMLLVFWKLTLIAGWFAV
jgi:hypothetical protein